MPVFPSGEWIDAFCGELASDPRAAGASAALGGVYRFVIDPYGPLRDRQTYELLLESQGEAVRVEQVAGAVSPRVTVSTDYGRWQQLLQGRLDLGSAMLFGRLRVSGDVAALLNARGDLDVIVGALRRVDTVWLETA